jgi:glyoxylase-like metal-dependent hydrolase (beta-lactamase superfamily II)
MYPIQLFDNDSSSYTYLLVDQAGREAVLIDPVAQHLVRDLLLLDRLGSRLAFVLETHAHADHVTSAGRLCERTGARSAVPRGCGIQCAQLQLDDGTLISFGDNESIRALHTPGHTAGSMSFLWRGNAFTGDTLLIDGCGRTDFQGGDAQALYASITEKLFSLPESTRVWPGHDYGGHSVSTIGWEKQHNKRLTGRDQASFVTLMNSLDLPKPRWIDVAVPANRTLGLDFGN